MTATKENSGLRERLKEQQKVERHLLRMREKLWDLPGGSVVNLGERAGGVKIRITDGPNAYMQYKDEFVRGVYRFTAARPDPVIIDGGSNMGVSILAFQQHYPQARITGFEPDPAIYKLLQENLQRNKVAGGEGVTLVNAGLAGKTGELAFAVDGSAGGRVVSGGDPGTIKVPVVCLSKYLTEPVDLVKLNIEGQELDVLREVEASGRFGNIGQLVFEYHGWAAGDGGGTGGQCLGEILNLLERQGYRYLIHDFDAETCPTTKPPFKHRPKANWFCVVHAQKP